MEYKIGLYDTIIRMSDNAGIPKDERNTDYQKYLEWLAEGNTPGPADPLPDPRIAESKAYLAATDYKMLPDYTVAPDGEPLASIVAKRATARELVRSLS
jgi:hypothetical protein